MTLTYYNQKMILLRKFLPQKALKLIRRYLTGILTPFSFAINSGHFKSSLLERAVDKRGNSIPWLTYPAIDFLNGKDLSQSTVLEFGGGQSTLFFSQKAKKVITFEGDQDWANFILDNPGNKSDINIVTSLGAETQIAEIRKTLHEKKFAGQIFDIVVIDALQREAITEFIMEMVPENGLMIFDNSESYPLNATTISKLTQHGFMRIDLYGHSPGVINKQCTSLFFKAECSYMRCDQDIFDLASV